MQTVPATTRAGAAYKISLIWQGAHHCHDLRGPGREDILWLAKRGWSRLLGEGWKQKKHLLSLCWI